MKEKKIFHKLSQNGINYFITNRKPFIPIGTIPDDIIERTFNFSYQMTFARTGEHRAYRTGGTHRRKDGEIFANTFQGKLAEFAVFLLLKKQGLNVEEPDLSVMKLGIWDTVDLVVGEKTLSIKSTKSFGNLLLLETNDWDDNAIYLPNGKG